MPRCWGWPACGQRRLQPDNAAPQSRGDGLRAVRGVQFLQDVLDVCVGSGLGDGQAEGNLFVAQARGNELKHFRFPRGQIRPGKVFRDPAAYLGWNVPLAFVHRAYGLDQFLPGHILEKISARSRFKRPVNLFVAGDGCQHYKGYIRRPAANTLDDFGSFDVRQQEIHQNDGRPQFIQQEERFGAGSGFSDHRNVGLSREHRIEAIANHRVIVHDHHGYGVSWIHKNRSIAGSVPLVTKLTNRYFFEALHRCADYDVSSESVCRLIRILIWSSPGIVHTSGCGTLMRFVFAPCCAATNTSLPEWIRQSLRFEGRLAKLLANGSRGARWTTGSYRCDE